MPIPTPNAGENQKEFIERCMTVLADEFPETDQRVAACMKQWRDSRSSSSRQEYRRYMVPGECFNVTATKKLVGHASVFNTLSEDRGGYFVMISPGAFLDSIKTDDVRALFNHDPNYVLGRTKSGTLKMSEDDRGLAIEVDLPDTSFARDLTVLMERGDVSQMSFGGIIRTETRHEDKDATIYVVKEFQLWDISPVTYPAFEVAECKVVKADTETPIVTHAGTVAPSRLFAAKRRLIDMAVAS